MIRFTEGLEFYKDTFMKAQGKRLLTLENTITKLEKYTSK
jgi:hypothetical protein